MLKSCLFPLIIGAAISLRVGAAESSPAPEVITLASADSLDSASEKSVSPDLQKELDEWQTLPFEKQTDDGRKQLLRKISEGGRGVAPYLLKQLDRFSTLSNSQKSFTLDALAATHDANAVTPLVKVFVASKDFDEQVAVLSSIQSLGKAAAIPLLVSHLECNPEGPDLLQRQKIADAVGATLRSLADKEDGSLQLVAEFNRMLPQATDVQKIRMAQVLQAAASRPAEDFLITLLDEKNYVVRSAAMVALSKTNSQMRAPNAILNLMHDADNNERKEACLALGRLKYLPAVPRLIELLNDRDFGVRSNAYWSLQNISGKSLPADPSMWTDWWANERAGSAIRFAALTDQIKSADENMIAPAVEELGELFLMRKEVIDTVTPLLKSKDFCVRAAACHVLGRMVDPKSIPALIEMLQDSKREVAFTAWRSLKELTGKDFPPSVADWHEWRRSTR